MFLENLGISIIIKCRIIDLILTKSGRITIEINLNSVSDFKERKE